jgi:hypothetical protein
MCLVNAATPADPNVPGILVNHRLDQSVTLRLTALTGRTTVQLDPHHSTVVVEGATTKPTGAQTGGSGWETDARAYRGKNSSQFIYTCPANGTRGEAWGSNPYSDQSSVCTAAVNFGLITVAKGGTVTIQIGPGQHAYTGSNRNGTTTGNFGAWDGSFTFAGKPAIANEAGYGGSGWGNNAFSYRGKNGTEWLYSCAPSPGLNLAQIDNVYGTGTYTDESPVCQAALHAGVITAAKGGDVIIQIEPGEASYKGSAQNGVTSLSETQFAGSYVFVKS